MKIEDLKDISEQEAKIIVDLYNSFVSDAEFYRDRIHKASHDDILHTIFTNRADRVETKLKIARKKGIVA